VKFCNIPNPFDFFPGCVGEFRWRQQRY